MGPNEAKLDKVRSAQPSMVRSAAQAWSKAAEGLGLVAEQIDTARSEIAQAWQGKDATAATAAFSSLATSVRSTETEMTSAATSLSTAADALHDAQQKLASLPAPPPVPTAP